MIKYKTFIIKTFNQVKNDNFDQVKFDQVSVSLFNSIQITLIKPQGRFSGASNNLYRQKIVFVSIQIKKIRFFFPIE
jgi:hypothetical protein